ncbi:Lactb, partial [Symbiodinium natans]
MAFEHFGARSSADRKISSNWQVRQVATPLRASFKVIASAEKTVASKARRRPASLSKPCPKLAGLDPKVMRETDSSLHRKVDSGEIPGVISVVLRNGVLAHLDAYGYADLERQVPMGLHTIVRLYSMTKCMVSVALGICMEEGLVQLNDPVSQFIPAFAEVKVKVEEDGVINALDRPLT